MSESSSKRAEELLEKLKDDQRRLWRQGQPLRVEDYLRQFPQLAERPDDVLDLIDNEVVQRQQRGEKLDEKELLEEYQQRFPHLIGELEFWFGVPVDPNPEKRPTVTYRCPSCRLRVPPHADTCPTCRAPLPRRGVPLPRVAGYEILCELGRGGMGIVYRAREAAPLNRDVALKMIRTEGPLTPEWRFRFRREAEALARLKHPHIVQVYAFGEGASQPFFAMELVEGPNLQQQLRLQLWAPGAAAALVETLARAVQAAHTRGLVHRDLKPANVLLTAEGAPKITDFGLARRLDRAVPPPLSGEETPGRGDHSAGVGTPAYMAPEQARALRKILEIQEGQTQTPEPTAPEQVPARPEEIGPATDVYALGAVLYEILTGKHPFEEAELAPARDGNEQRKRLWELLGRIEHDAPLPPSQRGTAVPRDLEAICLKCLEKDPARRYGSAEALADDLLAFREKRPIKARPVGWVGHGLYWVKRRPVVAGLAAVALLSLLIGSVTSTLFAIHAGQKAEDERVARERAEKRFQRNLRYIREVILARAYPDRINDDRLTCEALDAILHDLNELRREEPDSFETQFALAVTHLMRGEKDPATGLPKNVEEHLDKARSLFQALKRQTENLSVRFNLGVTHRALGERLATAGRADEALPELKKARELLRDVLLANPGRRPDDNRLDELARATVALARVLDRALSPGMAPKHKVVIEWLDEVACNLKARLPPSDGIEKEGLVQTPQDAEWPVWHRFVSTRDGKAVDSRKAEAAGWALPQTSHPTRAALCLRYLEVRQAQARLCERDGDLKSAATFLRKALFPLDRWPDLSKDAKVKQTTTSLEKQLATVNNKAKANAPRQPFRDDGGVMPGTLPAWPPPGDPFRDLRRDNTGNPFQPPQRLTPPLPSPLDADAVRRGRKAAQAGDWKRAVADLELAAHQPAAPFDVWSDLLLARYAAAAKDSRPSCRELLDRFERNAGASWALVYACLVAPCDDNDALRLVAVAACLTAERRDATTLTWFGSALYRVGRFECAARTLQEAIKVQGQGGYADSWLFLALAQQRLGQAKEARSSFASCEKRLQGQKFTTWQLKTRWGLLLKEARRLILTVPRSPE